MAAPVTVMHARAGQWLRITLCLLACLLACLPLKSVDAQTRTSLPARCSFLTRRGAVDKKESWEGRPLSEEIQIAIVTYCLICDGIPTDIRILFSKNAHCKRQCGSCGNERERTKVCVIIRTRMKHRTESKRNGKQNRKSLFKLCSARFSANRVVSECDR